MIEIKYRAYFKVKPKWMSHHMYYSAEEEENIGDWFVECEQEYAEQSVEPDFMQHLFIQDKNGKDIYYGDVVKKDGDPRNYIVILSYNGMLPFHSDQLKSVITDRRMPSINFLPLLGGKKATTFEVIGNVRENPELIK